MRGEKTSPQSRKYEKLIGEDEFYFLIQEEMRPEVSRIAIKVNEMKNAVEQKSRKDAKKPLYLMRYE
jgi:ACT domain-containing protein